MTWQKNIKDSLCNQQYYVVDGIYKISKTCHQGEWRYHLYRGDKKVGTYNSFEDAKCGIA